MTSDGQAVKDAIDLLTSDGRTNTSEGISFADTELAGANDRPDVDSPDFIVLITDGEPNEPAGSARTSAEAAADLPPEA